MSRSPTADDLTVPAPGTRFDPAGLYPQFLHPRVRAHMTTRAGGVSLGAYAGLNLRPGIGDDPAAVAANRRALQARLGVPLHRVDQVHGRAVHRFGSADDPTEPLAVADASLTRCAGLGCEIQVADCLPVLLADADGRGVAAAHAGWRGLADGVLEATVTALCEATGAVPQRLQAWLGACIGPDRFEVGSDVLEAFGSDARAPGPRFRPGVGRAERWLADLPALARDRLQATGVRAIGGNDGGTDWCTVGQPSRYFSFRRDRQTGRMAAVIWLTD
jgi:YfiH family protein